MALEKIDRLSEDGDIKTDLYELKVNLSQKDGSFAGHRGRI